jgi:hypothetical protein
MVAHFYGKITRQDFRPLSLLTPRDSLAYDSCMYDTVIDVIEAFGGPTRFAKAIGITVAAALKIKQRNRLIAEHLGPTFRAAKKQGIRLSAEDLIKIVER